MCTDTFVVQHVAAREDVAETSVWMISHTGYTSVLAGSDA